MSVFDKLKDVGKDALGTFVVLEDDAESGDQTLPAPGAAAPARAAAAPQTVAMPAPAAPAAGVDPEFVKQLEAAAAGSKKTAYTQFTALLAALSAVPDEGQRTQLALSAAQASHGITPADVVAAIDDRLRILAGEKGAFETAVKQETEQTIGGTMAQIEKARADIAQRQEQIRALEARAAELEKTVRESTVAITTNSARFAASYAAVEAGLAAERARLAPFISTGK